MQANIVGNAISYLRKRAGCTQKELADRLGISDKAVSKWERGLGLPDVGLIGKLAILLDTDTDSLLSGDVIYHDKEWFGLLFLDDNNFGIGADTIIYDKPLVYYLLSYFMLLGIKDINIVCNSKNSQYLYEKFEDGKRLGIKISCYASIPSDEYANKKGNVMIAFGRSIIYGVDQTRFFQKAMTHREQISVLSLPKKKTGSPYRIYFDSNKRIVTSDDGDQIRTQYDYYQIPILFCPCHIVGGIQAKNGSAYDAISEMLKDKNIYTVVLDRGFVEIPVDNWNDVLAASNFVKTIEKACGMKIYCIEEIAWRRGLISKKKFELCSEDEQGTEYGEYMRNLLN